MIHTYTTPSPCWPLPPSLQVPDSETGIESLCMAGGPTLVLYPHTHTLLPAAQVPVSETGKESLWWFQSSRWAEADVVHLRKV